MNYNEAIEYIHSSYKFGIKLGLENIKTLLNLLGNPQDSLKYVHIAGTNGKGSTAAYITQILMEAGYNVGTYTSPYLLRFAERIKFNNIEIEEETLAELTEKVREKVEAMAGMGLNHPTEFEIVTAIGFLYFALKKCDIVVLEVGLGGRFDSTNVINCPLVSVITSISLDHTRHLGETLAKIAYEKAGIIKEKGDVSIYPLEDEALRVVKQVCLEKNARLVSFGKNDVKVKSEGIFGQEFDFGRFKDLKITLPGEHQPYNAALAVQTVDLLREKGLKISDEAIINGLLKTKWPGRMEVVSRNPAVIIDGAHNPDAALKLTQSLSKYFPGKKIIFIMGVMKDKNYMEMIRAAAPIARCFIAVATLDESRSLPAEELAACIKQYCNNVLIGDTIKGAVDTALNLADQNDVICAFGSLYYIGEVKSLLEN